MQPICQYKGVFQLHIISLVPMEEGGGHLLKDYEGEEENRKRKTAGGGEGANHDFLLRKRVATETPPNGKQSRFVFILHYSFSFPLQIHNRMP